MSQFPFGFTGGSGDDKPGDDPLQALFAMLSGQGGTDPSALPFPMLAELQRMLSTGTGPVNWDLAGQLARQTAAEGDSSLTAAQRSEVAEAVRLAGLWLDEVTSFPTPPGEAVAWSRAEWVAGTLPAWQRLCDPVAARVVAALGHAIPAEAAAEAGPLMGVMRQVGGVVFGMQLGQALGTLAREVVGSTDVGLPLGPASGALLPAGVAAFGEGLEMPLDEVRLYLALREAAHQRLFAAAPWLSAHLFDAVDAYARGIEIDGSALTELVQGIDPTSFDPAELQDKLGEGLFQPRTTESQQAALDRLETALALVEGWVDEVVHAAAEARLPHATALRETVRRRRATGGPAEQTFATLVGLELRPRRLREAAALWAAVLADRGTDGREAVWRHPDLMPSAADLDDPAAFLRGAAEAGEDDLDAELRRITDGES